MSANTRSSGNHCVIFGCTNNYRKRKLLAEQTCDVHQQPRRVCGCELVKFHRFPADPEHRRLWIASVNRKDFLPSDSSRVCSVHFVSGERTETNPIPMRSLGYERKVKVGRRRIVRGDYVPTKRRRLPGDEVESAQPEPCAPIDYLSERCSPHGTLPVESTKAVQTEATWCFSGRMDAAVGTTIADRAVCQSTQTSPAAKKLPCIVCSCLLAFMMCPMQGSFFDLTADYDMCGT
ncbi:uncharacterized protein [Dermacentor albipictus]|uniref:uncharacterized protein isoform X2 n=1 Tax=Dermacentor albipictus TaxID=60249 RepID=UPI0038FCCA68